MGKKELAAGSAAKAGAGAKKSGRGEVSNGSGQEVFAKGLCFKKLLMIFVVGCLFGYFYEVILNCVVSLVQNGEWFFERRSGVIYGPFSVIYGAGAVLMAAALAERNYKWWQLFIYGGVICGVCEYVVGWLQEVFTGTMSWDYSTHFMNFNGRTSLQVMVIWGVISVVFIGVIYPFLSKWIERIPVKWGNILTWGLGIFLAVDMLVSFAAVVRMGMRRDNVPPVTPVGEFLDAAYPDEFMKKAYPNTEFVEDYGK